MRFMLMVTSKGYENAAPGAVPSSDAVARMMAYVLRWKTAALSKCVKSRRRAISPWMQAAAGALTI